MSGEAAARGAVALGYDSHATGSATIAIATRTRATGDWSFAIGESSQSSEWGAIALGVLSNAGGQFSTATCAYSRSTGENSLALGGLLGTSSATADDFRKTQATPARATA